MRRQLFGQAANGIFLSSYNARPERTPVSVSAQRMKRVAIIAMLSLFLVTFLTSSARSAFHSERFEDRSHERIGSSDDGRVVRIADLEPNHVDRESGRDEEENTASKPEEAQSAPIEEQKKESDPYEERQDVTTPPAQAWDVAPNAHDSPPDSEQADEQREDGLSAAREKDPWDAVPNPRDSVRDSEQADIEKANEVPDAREKDPWDQSVDDQFLTDREKAKEKEDAHEDKSQQTGNESNDDMWGRREPDTTWSAELDKQWDVVREHADRNAEKEEERVNDGEAPIANAEEEEEQRTAEGDRRQEEEENQSYGNDSQVGSETGSLSESPQSEDGQRNTTDTKTEDVSRTEEDDTPKDVEDEPEKTVGELLGEQYNQPKARPSEEQQQQLRPSPSAYPSLRSSPSPAEVLRAGYAAADDDYRHAIEKAENLKEIHDHARHDVVQLNAGYGVHASPSPAAAEQERAYSDLHEIDEPAPREDTEKTERQAEQTVGETADPDHQRDGEISKVNNTVPERRRSGGEGEGKTEPLRARYREEGDPEPQVVEGEKPAVEAEGPRDSNANGDNSLRAYYGGNNQTGEQEGDWHVEDESKEPRAAEESAKVEAEQQTAQNATGVPDGDDKQVAAANADEMPPKLSGGFRTGGQRDHPADDDNVENGERERHEQVQDAAADGPLDGTNEGGNGTVHNPADVEEPQPDVRSDAKGESEGKDPENAAEEKTDESPVRVDELKEDVVPRNQSTAEEEKADENAVDINANAESARVGDDAEGDSGSERVKDAVDGGEHEPVVPVVEEEKEGLHAEYGDDARDATKLVEEEDLKGAEDAREDSERNVVEKDAIATAKYGSDEGEDGSAKSATTSRREGDEASPAPPKDDAEGDLPNVVEDPVQEDVDVKPETPIAAHNGSDSNKEQALKGNEQVASGAGKEQQDVDGRASPKDEEREAAEKQREGTDAKAAERSREEDGKLVGRLKNTDTAPNTVARDADDVPDERARDSESERDVDGDVDKEDGHDARSDEKVVANSAMAAGDGDADAGEKRDPEVTRAPVESDRSDLEDASEQRPEDQQAREIVEQNELVEENEKIKDEAIDQPIPKDDAVDIREGKVSAVEESQATGDQSIDKNPREQAEALKRDDAGAQFALGDELDAADFHVPV